MEFPRAGNRFDSPTEDFSTCYFGSAPLVCYGETLSRFRPNPQLAEAADEAGFMGIGQVTADWRHQRVLLQAGVEPSQARPNLMFLDVEARDTREHLRKALGPILAFYKIDDLDVATVRGADRRITRWIAKWAYEAWDDNGERRFAGLRYLSRLDSDWECWAVFDETKTVELERRTITQQDEDLQAVARSFGLTVH